jgi:hypothetical protein
MATALDKNCTFLISTEKASALQQEEILKDLESAEVSSKVRFDYIRFVLAFYFVTFTILEH